MKKGAIVAVLSLFPLIASAAQALQEGKWKFDIRYDFIGIPQHFPEYSKTQCITLDDPLPDISRPGHECTKQLQGQFSRTYTWVENCSTDWEMVQGMGRIHYWGEQAQGDVHLQVVNPFNPPQPMVFRIRGQRIGNCEEKQ